MRKAMLFLVALLSVSFAIEVNNPNLATSAALELYENGTVGLTRGTFYDIEINLSVPVQSEYQKVRSGEPIRVDSLGNPYIRVADSSPPTPFSYSKKVSVETTARKTLELPQAYQPGAQESEYLAATKRTQSDSPTIRNLAKKITENATTPFEKAALLAIFVNNYMDYEEGMVGQEKDALWALENRRGVCTEYSTLFAALARSVGIPSRYLTGYVFSPKHNTWLGHAWNEVYLGKWVPVDATWLQAGSLDALHVESGKFLEFTDEPTLLATVSDQSASIEWETSGKSGAYANNIALTDAAFSEPDDEYVLRVVRPKLSPGEESLAYLELTGKDYRVATVELAACIGEGSVSVLGGEQKIVIEPGKKSVAAWIIRARENLEQDYLYTCPLLLNSPELSRRSVEVVVDPRTNAPADYEASLAKPVALRGEKNEAILKLPSSLVGKTFVIVTDGGSSTIRASTTTTRAEFEVAGLGGKTVYVASHEGGLKVLHYDAVSEKKLSIGEFTVPDVAVVGHDAIAHASVTSETYPADFELELVYEGKTSTSSGSIDRPTTLEFGFRPEKSGSSAMVLSISSAGNFDSQQKEVMAVIEPELSLGKAETKKSGSRLMTTLRIDAKGEPVNATMKIDGGSQMPAQSQEFELPEGSHELALEWNDLAGNQYQKTEPFEVKAPGLVDGLVPPPGAGDGAAGCLPMAIMLMAAGIAFAGRD